MATTNYRLHLSTMLAEIFVQCHRKIVKLASKSIDSPTAYCIYIMLIIIHSAPNIVFEVFEQTSRKAGLTRFFNHSSLSFYHQFLMINRELFVYGHFHLKNKKNFGHWQSGNSWLKRKERSNCRRASSESSIFLLS